MGLKDTLEDNYTIDPITGCFNWNYYINWYGYGTLRIDDTMVRAHRYYYEQKYGKTNKHIHHKCRNRKCVNLEHLEALDKVEHNHIHFAILDNETVAEIRLRISCGESIPEAASFMEINQATFKDALYGRTYKDCPFPPVKPKARTTQEQKQLILKVAKEKPYLSQERIGYLCGVTQKVVFTVLRDN